MKKDLLKYFIQAQEERLNLWLPVCFACGIAVYFALPFEPALWFSCLLFLICSVMTFFAKSVLKLALLGILFFTAGLVRINVQTWWQEAPFLSKKY